MKQNEILYVNALQLIWSIVFGFRNVIYLSEMTQFNWAWDEFQMQSFYSRNFCHHSYQFVWISKYISKSQMFIQSNWKLKFSWRPKTVQYIIFKSRKLTRALDKKTDNRNKFGNFRINRSNNNKLHGGWCITSIIMVGPRDERTKEEEKMRCEHIVNMQIAYGWKSHHKRFRHNKLKILKIGF